MKKQLLAGWLAVMFVCACACAAYAEENEEKALPLTSDTQTTEGEEEEEADEAVVAQLQRMEDTRAHLEGVRRTQQEIEDLRDLSDLRAKRQREFDAGNMTRVDDLNRQIHSLRQTVHTKRASRPYEASTEAAVTGQTE